MRLVSFDVGLRNLAFCVMEGTSRKNLRILHWDLIDVMAEGSENGSNTCFKCKSTATWTKENLYACSSHKTGQKIFTKTTLAKMKVEELRKRALEHSLTGQTKKDLVENLYLFYSKNAWKRCVKSCKAGSVVDLAPMICASLTSRMDMWKGNDLVIFEQQPDRRMLAVQGMMHMWFVCQGWKCRGISASHKLTNIVFPTDETKTYKGRKKTGIVHASALVPTPANKEFMLKHPKKDDLADCFLQGLWALENGFNKPVKK